MQQLEVSIQIPIPEDSVLISKVELKQFQQNELQGVYWNMKELEKRTGKSGVWLREYVLYPERFRKVLDVENGGFVSYPIASGQPWVFQAKRMAQFLEENFHRIFKER